ncbi:hypothetical protein NW754_009737 [Fusarium falciforme]|nr:hypothetical protein NW754_009737 [Fusarium falciforme]
MAGRFRVFRLLYELHAPGGLRHTSRYGLAYQEAASMARNLEVDGAWETLDGKLSYSSNRPFGQQHTAEPTPQPSHWQSLRNIGHDNASPEQPITVWYRFDMSTRPS